VTSNLDDVTPKGKTVVIRKGISLVKISIEISRFLGDNFG